MFWLLKKLWYHIFQFFFFKAAYLLPWRQSIIIDGPGSVVKLPEYMAPFHVRKVLIVTDKTLMRLGLLNKLLDSLSAYKIEYSIYDGVEPNPSIENIEAARAVYINQGCDGIIAFGGGSSMDCAKACGARIVKPKQSVEKMGGLLKILKKLPPLFAVATTAGTGSETTVTAVVTDRSSHHKYAVNDLALIPLYAVLDPEITIQLPPHITATTGIDALTHAVEAYINRYAPANTKKRSIEATRLIFQNLPVAYKDGGNIQARQNMLTASNQAGAAFTRIGVGNVHAIAHTLGGIYGTPHGLANAVILPYVLDAYGPAVDKPLSELADAAGIPGQTPHDKALAFIAAIRAMNQKMGIPDRFDYILEQDIPQMIQWAMLEANPTYPVPVIWGKEEFGRVIERVRTGRSDMAG